MEIKRTVWRAAKTGILKIIFPAVYKIEALKPIKKNKLIFVEERFEQLNDSYALLYERLDRAGNYDIRIHYLRNGFVSLKQQFKRMLALVKDSATARCVFFSDTAEVFCGCRIRQGCDIVQLWHACGAFKKWGLSVADLLFGMDKRDYMRYSMHDRYTLLTVSSPEVIWAYAEAMGLEAHREIIKPLGISRTDKFFDPAFLTQAREKFKRLCPDAGKKTVILYAPTFRGRVAEARSGDALDLELLHERLGGQYLLLFKYHPFVKERRRIPEAHLGFAVDMTDSMDIQELLCIADICITDYSSLIFEYALFERPMIFFAHDLEEYYDWRGFYYNYDEMTPGDVCTTTKEVADCIQDLAHNFDIMPVQRFKKKFMSACDGNATDRIIKYIFDRGE